MKTTVSFTIDVELVQRLERSKKKKSVVVNDALRQYFKLESEDEKLDSFSEEELKDIYDQTHARLVVFGDLLSERTKKKNEELSAEAARESSKQLAASKFWGGKPPETLEEAKKKLAEAV